ncbi:MAG: AraC family transcriptional regulator [Bacteroidota bacterium]
MPANNESAILSFGTLDIIHILSIFVQVPLILVLLFKGRRRIANQLMAFFFFAQILASLDFLIWSQMGEIQELYPYLVYWATPFFTVWGPTLFLYIKSQTESDFKLKMSALFHYIPFVFITLYFLLFYHIHDITEKQALLSSQRIYQFSVTNGLSIFISIQVFAYNLGSIFTLEYYAKNCKSTKSEVLKRIRWNRFIIYGYFSACLINVTGKVLYAVSFIDSVNHYMHISGLVFLLYFTTILGNALLGSHFGSRIIKMSSEKYSPKEYEALKLTLETYLENKKPFLQFKLSLKELAQNIGSSQRLLSNFINSYEHTTFQDYINRYRVVEAKKLITENIDTGKTILEIVYESGFNSKSAFNAAFKKHAKTTPTLFKKSLQKD